MRLTRLTEQGQFSACFFDLNWDKTEYTTIKPDTAVHSVKHTASESQSVKVTECEGHRV